MHVDPQYFYDTVGAFLGPYYIVLAMMNGLAALYLWRTGRMTTVWEANLGGMSFRVTNAMVWLLVSGVFVVLAPLAASGNPAWMPSVPEAVKAFINQSTGPVVYSVVTMLGLIVLYVFRSLFVKPAVAWTLLNLSLLFLGLSMTDEYFYAIVAKPDNVPIVALMFLLGFFTWLGASQAVQNDERLAKGLPPREKEDNEKILVWPDLVYTELICMVAVTALLIFWAIALEAPLEEPASSVKTPNPSKAPWYFLGLQEMLVYYDPWMAGVVLPSLVVFGLMAIPFIDFNQRGNGYYTITERRFSYIIFQIGFLEMWITLIILGTFLRGPNWGFFGPYEFWDPHKVEALNNVDLSQYFWILGLGRSLPRAPLGSSFWVELAYILLREAPGILLVGAYFVLLPPIMAVTVFRKFYLKMGFVRYMVMATLLLFMAALPIKMVLRWTVNLKYIIAIPEYFLNF
ncbi:MAG: hypothetical protein WDZ59_02535 [Pirellulales bacterium]